MNAADKRGIEAIAAALRLREPLFHRREWGTARADFERMMAEEFREVGASGEIYSRTFVLDTLERRHRDPVAEALQVTNFACQQVATDLFLVTYTLKQSTRVTRRATLWRQASEGWRVVYHQGTVVAGEP